MKVKTKCAILAFGAGCLNIPMVIINIGTKNPAVFISLGAMFFCWGIAGYIMGKR